jgi:peptide/nickel transport system permease protein
MVLALLRRTGIFLVSLVAASILVFAIMWVLPGDPAQVALGVNASPEAVADLRERFGLDRPVVVQYLDWMGGLVTGDMGTSYRSGLQIAPQVIDRFMVTAWLVGAAIIIAMLIAVPLGSLSAIRHRRTDGAVISGASQIGIAVPSFLAGLLLVAVFSIRLRWFPAGGWVAPAENPVEFVRHVTLPALVLGLVQGAVLTRYVRSAVLDVLGEDYMRTARSKGLRPWAALVRHGLRNAAVPVVTVLALQLATLLIGAVVVERVFVIPGLGSLLLDSVRNRDLLLAQGTVMALVMAVLVINYLVDVAYTIIDPRLRVA